VLSHSVAKLVLLAVSVLFAETRNGVELPMLPVTVPASLT